MSEDFNILDFFEEEEAQSQGGASQGVVCKGRVTPGFYAMEKGHSKFFPSPDVSTRSSVRASAAAHLESVGGKVSKQNPTVAFEFLRYRDTFLNTKSPKWENETFVQVFHGRHLPTGEFKDDGSPIYDSVIDWRIFTAPIKNSPDDIGKYAKGEDFWFHYVSIPNPTFVAEDESTHTQYNHWVTAEGALMPNFIEQIKAAFATKEEALEYMEENGIALAGVADSEVEDVFTALYEKVLSSVEKPDGFNGPDWDDDDYVSLLPALVKNLMAGTEVKSLVDDHAGTPMDKKFILKVKKLVE